MRSSVRGPFQRALRMGLLAKVVVGATVAFTGAGAVAATHALPDDGDSPVAATPAAADPAAAISVADLAAQLAHEGLAHQADVEDAADADDAEDAADADEEGPEETPVETAAQPGDVAARQDDAPAVVEVEEDDVDDATQDDTADDADDVDDATQDDVDDATQDDTADDAAEDVDDATQDDDAHDDTDDGALGDAAEQED